MRIINTAANLKLLKKRILYSCFIFLFLLIGCSQKGDLEQARKSTKEAGACYQRAVDQYQNLIKHSADKEKLYFELGNLYYNHGDFAKAVEAFKYAPGASGRTLTAISYYRLGNFTDALEVFSKAEPCESECLYYYGLTSEKLNLFDQALDIYKKIKDRQFADLARLRIDTIEKQAKSANIKEVSPETSKILMTAPAPEQYPQAGALILYCDEKIETTSLATQVSTSHYIVKILNERGKKNFSEMHIGYDSTYEKVELEYARSIKSDGSVTEVGSRHMRDVSRYLNFPLYSNARVFIISFPEISAGTSIEYKVKVYSNKLINKKDFAMSYPTQSSEPIISAKFTLICPKEYKLNIKMLNEKYNDFNAELAPKREEKDGRLTYSWQFKGIPQIMPEPSMPVGVEINPTVLISTFSSWQDIYSWWWGLAKDKIRADQAIMEEVLRLTKGAGSEEAKIRAIYNFCAKDIRYVAVEYGQAGYEPHNAADIFRNKYGDCKDQAILLVTMLRQAGFSSWPVLISTRGYYNLNKDFPSMLFNHCIAAVLFKGKIVFMDPTAETCSFTDLPSADQARSVLLFKESGYSIENTPLYPAQHNLKRQENKIKINEDESINAAKKVFTRGVYDQGQRYWLLYTQPELIKEALKEAIQNVCLGSELLDYDIENLDNLNEPIVLSYSFKGREYLTMAGNLRVMPALVTQDTSLVAKDKRKYPLDFSVLETNESMFEIELPKNLNVKYMPENVQEDSPWMSFTAEYMKKDNRILFRGKLASKKREIPESEYSDFKNFLEGLSKRVKQSIILERIK